ncbi:MAG: insulinase family protein [Bacteroidetes bacterium]|nr:insulinase family protein [Bacteroidota bacterium]
MKLLKLLAVAMLILNMTTNAQDYKWVEKKSPDGKYTYKTVSNDPLGVRVYTLKNGLTVLLSVNKATPRIQTYIATKAGSKNDPHDNTGLAHYLEHMLFKGTNKYGTKDWAKESVQLEKIHDLYEKYNKTTDAAQRKKIYHEIDSVYGEAAKFAIANEYDKITQSIGAKGTNAFTSVEQTVYVNDIPGNQLEKWLLIEAERFRYPVLRLFHTELEAVYEEKNIGLDRGINKMYEKLMEQLFTKHTYGTQTTIGTVEHLKNPSLKKIRDYYNTWYVPNNMAIILAGDFDADKTIEMIELQHAYFQWAT